jgi:hypothetical protein
MGDLIGDENQYCDPGYFCNEGSDIPNPLQNADGTVDKGGLCERGYYCPRGSATMTPCAPGYYERREGSEECQECPVGYYCPQDVTPDP